MYKWVGRVGIVTGASSAVGMAICRELVEHGMTIIALARESGIVKLDVRRIMNFLFLDDKKRSNENRI